MATTINIGDKIIFKAICAYPTAKVSRKVIGIHDGLPEVRFAGHKDFLVRLSEIIEVKHEC